MNKMLKKLLSIVLCIIVLVAFSINAFAASRSTIIQGYNCTHTYRFFSSSIQGETGAAYSYGMGFPTITCKVTAKGIFTDGSQTGEAYATDMSTGDSIGAHCDVGSGPFLFSDGESKAYFMSGLWSTY